MYNLQELISKPVISLYNCEFIGFVYNILFDKISKKIKYMLVVDEESNIEYSLKINDIVTLSEDAIMIKNSECLTLSNSMELELEQYQNLSMKPVYDVNGTDMGTINNVSIDDAFKIKYLHTNKNQKIDERSIAKIEKIVLCSTTKINLSKYKKRRKPTPTNTLVEIQAPQPKLPNKAIINENMLLNRMVYNNIYDEHKKVIIKANTIINNYVIELAKKYGKMKELIRYSF